MSAHISAPEDLVLHAPRVMGFASAPLVAVRHGLDPDMAHDLLLDFEARGWVQYSSFGDRSGWSMTSAGRTEDERRLAAEIGVAEVRAAVRHSIRSSSLSWDERVLRMLTSLGQELGHLCTQLTDCLQRFDGYADRCSRALAKVGAGQRRWVDAPEVDSCHTVWIQFHEDLLAALGVPRGSDA